MCIARLLAGRWRQMGVWHGKKPLLQAGSGQQDKTSGGTHGSTGAVRAPLNGYHTVLQ